MINTNFTLDLKKSTKLLWGQFTILNDQGKQVATFVATSGVAGFQTPDYFKTRGKGPIPPYKPYFIDPNCYYLATKGIEGMFFSIKPDPIPGYGRSEIGIHHDANVPGSSGCIVIQNKKSFVEQVVPLLLAEKQNIPLDVEYLFNGNPLKI